MLPHTPYPILTRCEAAGDGRLAKRPSLWVARARYCRVISISPAMLMLMVWFGAPVPDMVCSMWILV
jgi:hypothetical protein